ncbi:MAG: hypothetical protein Q8L74_06155 [Nitrospirota bacterium]|nr:hypothetical protein [Nitrospirota bacterium]
MNLLLHQFSPTAQVLDIVTSIKADIVSWGVVFIGVALTLYAYHRIYALVAEREATRETEEERDEQMDAYMIRRIDADDDYDFRIKD